MSLRKLLFCVLSSIILMLIFSSACRHATEINEVDTSVITPVTITSVTVKPVTETIVLSGVTAFLIRSTVRSSTTGTVENISITPGDRVRKGQILAGIRTRESAAIKNSLQNDSTFSFKGRIEVISTASGIVSALSHQDGDFVEEGDELAVIADENSLVFILDTPFDQAGIVENNKTCKIQLPDDQIITGNLISRLPEMDPQAQTVKYIVKPVYSGHLPANLNAKIFIVKSKKPKATVVSKTAVLSNETQTEFWVMKLINDTTAVKIPVVKGFEDTEEVEITSPLFLPADRIILTGSYGLPDTARVIVR